MGKKYAMRNSIWFTKKEEREFLKECQKCPPPPPIAHTIFVITCLISAVFYTYKSLQIHLGHGIWLKESTYRAAIMNARTPSMFVKNMAVAVFGVDVLANSSVTGKTHNRAVNRKSTKADDCDRKFKPKLDSTKLMAIRGMKYFLLKF